MTANPQGPVRVVPLEPTPEILLELAALTVRRIGGVSQIKSEAQLRDAWEQILSAAPSPAAPEGVDAPLPDAVGVVERLSMQGAELSSLPCGQVMLEAVTLIQSQAARIAELEADKAGHDEAFEGVVCAKIEAEQRLEEMRTNHDGALRLYSQWRSRAEKAEARSLLSEGEGADA